MSSDEDNDDDKKDRLNDKAVEQAKHEALFGTGYKSPPRHTQFKKGMSGNPKGRPRRVRNEEIDFADQPLFQNARRIANQKLTVREGNKTVEMTKREIALNTAFKEGVSGNARMLGIWLEHALKADLLWPKHIRAQAERVAAWKEEQQKLIEEAQREGRDTRLILPHPDDIEFHGEEGCRITGPFDEESLLRIEELARMRDVLFLQEALDERTHSPAPDVPEDEESVLSRPGAGLVAWLINDRCLPARFKLDNYAVLGIRMRYDRLNRRELLKATYQAWQSIGARRPRGQPFVTGRRIVQCLGFHFDLYNAVRDGRVDIDAMARGEMNEPFLAIAHKHGIRLISAEGDQGVRV